MPWNAFFARRIEGVSALETKPFVCGEVREYLGALGSGWIIGCLRLDPTPYQLRPPLRILFERRRGGRCIRALPIGELGLREAVEFDGALTAIDVAEARGACLDAKEGEASVVGAAVVFADANHMLESSFAHGVAHLGVVC